MKKNVLVLGANGQLGQSLRKIITSSKVGFLSFVFLTKKELDITDFKEVEKKVKKYNPKYVINCAAYTQVDLAEDFKEKAYILNVIGPENLATVCLKLDCILIHISTDFVFEGNKLNLLREEFNCKPINYYGESKLKGEEIIQKVIKKFFIIRTSWLYSEFGNNFLKTMLRLGDEKDYINVVHDQIGTPTYAPDLAEFIVHLINVESYKYGVYHYSNEGLASWYDFAKSIFEYTSNQIKVIPISSTEYKTKAKRPSFSVLDKAKVKKEQKIEINHWRESLKKCLKKI